ncbi:MAG: type II and III secretion system protein family protein [Hyphomonadaceae bacterium]|nr:type II and III secretion system protein family protein [Hyphomonadaceae bacterium]
MSANRNIVLFGLATALSCGAPAFAQNNQQQLSGAPAAQITVPDVNAADVSQEITLTVNKSYMIEFDTDIDDIIIANPAIANVTARDRRRVAVMGVAPGESNIVFLDRSGRKLKVLEVSVTDGVAGMDQLRGLIKKYVPTSKVQVEAVNGRIILAGRVPNLSAADRVVQLAKPYAKDDASILNLMTIDGKDQVTLKVRFVEMQRSVIKQMGINLSGSIGFGQLTGNSFDNVFNFASANGFPIQGTALGGIAANLGYQNLVGAALQSSLGARIDALERVGVVRTLAEPNLAAISGEAGKFLVGGEFPVPVAQDQGQITVAFKPFGVGLGYTPVVLSEGRISLQVSVEVSELSQTGGFSSRVGTGIDPDTGEPTSSAILTIPALKVRRAETTVEIPSGGSLVIAGLIQESTRQSLDGLPGAKDIPILGALFRSRDFVNDETELVVIVTPYLVDPTDPQGFRDPDRGFVTPRDLRTVLFGKLNEVYAVPGSTVGKAPAPKGSSGFIVD